MKRKLTIASLIGAITATLFLFGTDCVAADDPKDKAKDLPDAKQLEPCQLGSVERLHTLGRVFLASQPKPDDFKFARERGIKTVINLREKDETDWDERSVVENLGMQYHNLSFRTPAELTDEVFDQARKVLNDKDAKPVLMHCASANRVGAIWLAHRVLDHNVRYDDALKEAETVGLKLPALTEKAKGYIDRKK